MTRTTIATVLAAALALAAVPAAPARADHDLARFLAGATALMIIGKAISDSGREKERVEYVHVRPRYREHDEPPRYHRRHKPPLPGWCLRILDNRRGEHRRVFSARCLQRHYDWADRLPRVCRDSVRTLDGWYRVYGAKCLRRHGFKMAKR